MNLTIETALHGVATALRERIAPALTDSFAGEAARLAEILVTLCASSVDGAVAVRAEENAAIRALFADAAPVVNDAATAARLTDAARSSDPGLRISDLDRENGRLRQMLIDLHAQVEGQDGIAAREVDRRIWCLMRDAEAARFPS